MPMLIIGGEKPSKMMGRERMSDEDESSDSEDTKKSAAALVAKALGIDDANTAKLAKALSLFFEACDSEGEE